ncbi:glucose dehydrogenase [FAD, quinone]-like [Macrosteles quadrilineatus]|uniref:glucose dehydrogenase [FAD, quinone]-like n=1 Tax=Macrosteles quadrilineatus TaxID=74068 RepID=UPI0023E304CB|nr:glucose dehydrogenase [FAD, quinone]-like [Macrosteles quadrilineatus]
MQILLFTALLLSAAADDYPPLFPALMSFVGDVNQHSSNEPRSVPRPLSSYDFIIVGAGSAGCVIANRLTEVADWKVLLIEAGREESFLMDIPILANMFQFTDANWKYKSVPSENYCLGLHRNQCNIPRGKVMGGSSVLNYMIYNRGHPRDYDHWRDLGNPGWGYRDVMPYFLKLEDLQVNEEMDMRYHSRGGYLTVTDIPTRTAVARAFVEAGQELGFDQVDYNGQYQQGFSYHQVTMKNGTRMSTSRAYLHPIRNRKNLHVLKSTMVTKILINKDTNTAEGVEIIMRGKKHRILARKEVILSAGAINSPQLLMLSGIGPKDHLEEMGVKCLVNLPVGYNLMDHVALGGMTFLIKSNSSIISERIMDDPDMIYRFMKHREGVIAIPGGTEALAFIDLKNPRDPAGYPDLELLLTSATLSGEDTLKENFGIKDNIYNSVYKPIKGQDGFMIMPMVLRPKSKGRVYLKSLNPLAAPAIELGYFKDKRDLEVLVKGVRLSSKLVETKAFEELKPKRHNIPLPGCRHLKMDSDEYWKCHARHLSFTIYHQSGTVAMGPKNCLDSRLRVHNVSRLRVVDASIFPEIPASHPNAIVVMIAEKASDMIKEDWDRANE